MKNKYLFLLLFLFFSQFTSAQIVSDFEEAQSLSLGLESDNDRTKKIFFNQSDFYYRKSLKQTVSVDQSTEAKLAMVLNKVYQGNHKKALKQLEKMQVATDSQEIEDLKNFIFAFCYKCDGDVQKMESYKQKIKDQAILAKLN